MVKSKHKYVPGIKVMWWKGKSDVIHLDPVCMRQSLLSNEQKIERKKNTLKLNEKQIITSKPRKHN